MTNSVLSREAFFAACPKPRVDEVEIEGIGKVRIKQLTAGAMEGINSESKGNYDITMRTIQACVLDDKGQPIFKSRDEVAELPSAIFGKFGEAVNKVNGFDPKATEKKSEPAAS